MTYPKLVQEQDRRRAARFRSSSRSIAAASGPAIVSPALPKRPRRTKRKGRRPSNDLTAAFCRHVAETGRYCDSNGLYLQVDPSGARRWIQKLVIQGSPA